VETDEERHARRLKERDDKIAACPVKETDLLSISRGTDKCRSYVSLEWDWETRVTWLKFGEATLRKKGEKHDGRWDLEARMGLGATDFEHDTAYALRLPLVGVEFEWADHHQFRFRAFVAAINLKMWPTVASASACCPGSSGRTLQSPTKLLVGQERAGEVQDV
jgi:hypothetical protein